VRDVNEAKKLLIEAAETLFTTGVMQFSGHGNLSARLDADRIVITSRGTIRSLTPADFAVVTLSGEVLDGHLEPANAEIVRMHTGVYGVREEAGAVIHTHSPHATAFALAHEPLPCVYEAVLRQGVAEAIPVAAWAPRGSEESVSNIVAELEQHPGVPAVLLANHGILASGRNPLAAASFVVAMEESALLTLQARALGGARGFPAGAIERERAHMARFGSRA
jgi:L-fuculose-phosphate aldolase